MPDINFASFNTRSFEQFAQALAAEILGRGLLIFGDGPDGGREAAFDGAVPYPTTVAPWNGYIVMQAKFRQSRGEGEKDPEWLITQLKAEMDTLAQHPDRRVPDYYLLVTNVRLSGVSDKARKGGQQKLDDAFEQYCRPLGIRKLDVWHAERIGVLIDGQPDLHRSYEAWLTPREVLSAAFHFFNARSPDFGAIMSRYLQREFRTQRDTRLREAGHVGDGGPSLEDVFIDLPCAGEATDLDTRTQLAPGGTGQPDEIPLVVEALLGRLALKLDPMTLEETRTTQKGAAYARNLLLGGPGQGKSTISQFLGQVARWRLLTCENRTTLPPDTIQPLDNFSARAEALGIRPDGVRRYPVRIDLPSFADALDRSARNDQSLSLLAYITHHIRQTADADIAIEDVRGWLSAYPWLLLLDGLDEVPPSGNRKAVLRAITNFWDEAQPLNADVAMVVTSRPQGYHDDLDPNLYMKVELAPLDRERALRYADRLAFLKLPDPERRERVLDRLTKAADTPATAALMISPLQVAILFQLVEQRGQAPTDRWSLFHEYLGTVMKREQEKSGPSGETMRRWSREVHTLVRRAGLLLHTLAEADGAASSHLSVEQLADLVRDLLREDGHPETDAALIADEVITATTDRLAFLEQREEGRYAFEVRSLQEYAAAAALMAGREADIIRRLSSIAGYAHWQHVYRIAASKAFADPDSAIYRETIVGINRGLDDADTTARAVRLGARVSLDLVDDGLAAGQPTYRRQLVVHAMDLVRLGRDKALERLVDPLVDLGEDFGRPLLTDAIHGGSQAHREAGWQLLFTLTHDAPWATALIDALAPTDPMRLTEAIASLEEASAQVCFEQLLARAPAVSVSLVGDALKRRQSEQTSNEELDFFSLIPVLAAVQSNAVHRARDIPLLNTSHRSMRFLLNTFDEMRKCPWWTSPLASSWPLTPLVARFMTDPSITTLADFAAGLSSTGCEDAHTLALPWVLNTVAALARDMDRAVLAQQILDGKFGTPADWTAAEQRLTKNGITQADLDLWAKGIFFDDSVATLGGPYFPSVRRSPVQREESWARPLLDATIIAPEGQAREQLRFVLGLAIHDGGLKRLSAQDLLASLLSSPVRWLQPSWLKAVPVEELATPALLDRLRTFAREGRVSLGSKLDKGEFESQLVRLAREAEDADLFVIAVCGLGNVPQRLRNAAAELREAAHLAAASPIKGYRALAASVLVTIGEMDAADALNAVFAENDETCGLHSLVNLAKMARIDMAVRKELLTNGLDRMRELAPGLYASCVEELNRLLDMRRAELHRRSNWTTLNLPPSLFDRLEAIRPIENQRDLASIAEI